MKKSITITLTMILLGTATLLAQSGRTPKQPAEQTPPDQRGIERQGNGKQGGPGRIPNLTDEQKGQLQTIRQQEREQIDAVKNNSTLSDAEKRSQIDTIRQNSREQSQGVLTPEQRQAAGNRNGGGRPGEMGGQPGGRGPQGGQPGEQPNIGGRQGQPGGFGGGRMGGGQGGFGGGQRPGGGGMGSGARGGRP